MFCSHLLTSSLFKKILLSKIPIQVGRSGKETLSLFPRWCREAGRVRSRLVLLQSREQSWISSRQLDPTATWCVPCGGVGGGGGPPSESKGNDHRKRHPPWVGPGLQVCLPLSWLTLAHLSFPPPLSCHRTPQTSGQDVASLPNPALLPAPCSLPTPQTTPAP